MAWAGLLIQLGQPFSGACRINERPHPSEESPGWGHLSLDRFPDMRRRPRRSRATRFPPPHTADRGGRHAPARLLRGIFNSAPGGPWAERLLLANSPPTDEDSARAAGVSGGEWGDDHGPRNQDPTSDGRRDGPYETVEGLANEAQPRIGASITHTTRRAGESDRGARAAGVPTDRRMLLEPRETLRN